MIIDLRERLMKKGGIEDKIRIMKVSPREWLNVAGTHNSEKAGERLLNKRQEFIAKLKETGENMNEYDFQLVVEGDQRKLQGRYTGENDRRISL